jgi:hypothetical protein
MRLSFGMAALFASKGVGYGLSLIGATPSFWVFWVACLMAFSSSLEPSQLTGTELKLGCSIRLPKFSFTSLASPHSLKTKGALGPYCFTPTAVCPRVSLMLSTVIVICSEPLVTSTPTASSFSLLPTGLTQPWTAFRLLTCAPRLLKTSRLNQLEQARFKGLEADVRSSAFHLGIRPLSKPQLTHINCNRFSTGFLLSQNDVVGTLTPDQFLVAFANYLGEPCLIFSRLQGLYIVHCTHHRLVDMYGDEVAAFTTLSGDHRRQVHDEIARVFGNFARAAGIPTASEPATGHVCVWHLS